MEMYEMVRDCIENPIRSRHHDWADGQQAEYNLLKVGGRRLYDNLRTKYDIGHTQAYISAAVLFGLKNI